MVTATANPPSARRRFQYPSEFAWTLFALIFTLMAAKLGGVVGMVVGIPVYTVLRVIARTFFSEFKLVQRLTDHLDE